MVLSDLRQAIREANGASEAATVERLVGEAALTLEARATITAAAAELVEKVRREPPSLLEGFLAEYSLSSDEGVALMCLAEALLRVPDAPTVDELIQDKIAFSSWLRHFDLGNAALVNVSTLMLTLAGEVLRDSQAGVTGLLRSAAQRLGEPIIRAAVQRAMRILGGQFVLGRDIGEALDNAKAAERRGFTYSYDMLGEAARTADDAARYREAYVTAIREVGTRAASSRVRENPGISVKLSALHPRYEVAQRERVMAELVPRTLELAVMARDANMGFNIDAEEAERLDLSLDVIAAVLADPRLAGWDGFGIVVQAYGLRAGPVIDWIGALAQTLDRRVMVRLVKGAYWDAEIKRAQVLGLPGFPVFSSKPATDVSYIANARKLLLQRERLYPQFATHNATSVAAVLHLAEELGATTNAYEFQRLHGMGERLHEVLTTEAGTTTRIYAPVGKHSDLLSYLVRRLLENGANGSFVNLLADRELAATAVATDPFTALGARNERVKAPGALFAPERVNSRGADLSDPLVLARLDEEREVFDTRFWTAGQGDGARVVITNPATGAPVGEAVSTTPAAIEAAVAAAKRAAPAWAARPVADRAGVLRGAADLYEAHAAELYALCTREAGKTLADAVGEVREAVDFLRYYAAEAERLPQVAPRGTFACISPWNFPLSIFTGQVVAALVTGNAVLAKPAETTPLIAARAVALLHDAGVPPDVLQLLVGEGRIVGNALVSNAGVDGVCFTGSLATAQAINRAMAEHLAPDSPLIAETGGINAMIVDSTALPEQAVRDILASAFQSAGQRCSALRILYVQEDVAERTLKMLFGAMDELVVGDPWALAADVGPVITAAARDKMEAYIAGFTRRGRLLKRVDAPADLPVGTFVLPTVLQVPGIADMAEEIFGPVLHVATFKAAVLERVVADINAAGYGLTFALHSRIDSRVEAITAAVHAGNIYVNRNQIGAVVGSQPFGGEGLSGTGPKAGGPHYLPRFQRAGARAVPAAATEVMPGPTGESNVLRLHPRGMVLCLGPDEASAREQEQLASAAGNTVISGLDGAPALAELAIDAVMHFGNEAELRAVRQALAKRDGAIVPLFSSPDDARYLSIERHVCIDTTASGGNVGLLAGTPPAMAN